MDTITEYKKREKIIFQTIKKTFQNQFHNELVSTYLYEFFLPKKIYIDYFKMGNQASDEFQTFIRQFQTEFVSLKELQIFSTLAWYQTTNFMQTTVQILANKIGRMPNLEIMTLNFEEHIPLQDKSVTYLLSNIPQNLLYLDLSFMGCINISDQSLKSLKSLHMCKKLETLILDFQKCNNITDEGFKYFIRLIPDTLRNLQLFFIDCKNITDSAIASLERKIQQLKHLEFVQFDFGGNCLSNDAYEVLMFLQEKYSNISICFNDTTNNNTNNTRK